MSLDNLLSARANIAPLIAALNALIKVTHTLFNVASQHIVLVNLLAATTDDLIADLCKQALHSVHGVIVLAKLEDDANIV